LGSRLTAETNEQRMNIYLYGRPASSAPRQHHQNSKQHDRRWDLIRDAIDREHRELALADPRSPRIKPTLWSVR
jgi:hypothetical protein